MPKANLTAVANDEDAGRTSRIARDESVAALRFLAAVCQEPRETNLTDEEAFGFGVIVTMLADKIQEIRI